MRTLALFLCLTGTARVHAESCAFLPAPVIDLDDEKAEACKAMMYHIKNLKDNDATVRENAAEMLGILNAPESVIAQGS